ncbi:hypothetical protein O1611_g2276 [Lasiodiplodia mahajangana]|uniref:Uncharacterized protein n=1 Tax=Lasiodiplodia mahajangana TaxID=1108764 RepID=A0ACC2JVC7_9PEZI|nr:hypothetical protein O1611_g2276 [Lasiodiplodia mahajangana]
MSENDSAHAYGGAEFHGQGIQNFGNINVDRDLNIGMTPSSLSHQEVNGLEAARTSAHDALLKVRLTDPRDDKSRIEEQKGGLLRDSYKWVLDHNDFKRWRDGDGHQFLWVRGDPGKGKTMLLCGIIDELNETSMKNWNVAYYFCQATIEKLNTATSVLRGLIFLLLCKQPRLLGTVQNSINEASKEGFLDMNGWPALRRIFSQLIAETEKRGQTTYLLIDALDECLENQDRLLSWITSLPFSRIKVLVSSRNWPSIKNGLSGPTRKVLLQLELNADSITEAVDHYIDYKTAQLATSKELDTQTRDVIRKDLKSKSNNTFLWVALVCQKLSNKDINPWEVLTVLDEFPPGLDELYERMARQFLTSRNANMCCQVLAVQARAYRPLVLTELSTLVELPKDEKWLRQIVELCGSFLTVRAGTIYFVHQSAKDYLIENMVGSEFLPAFQAGHHTIFRKSIQALSRALQENIYRLPSTSSSLDNIEVPNPNPLDGIGYACIYWADHLENAERLDSSSLAKRQDLEDGGLLHKFLEGHLLHWFEALSLLKSLATGIEALTKTLSLLREGKKDATGLGKLVYDATRFSRYHKTGIEATPLQVYSSALIFSPTLSIVRKLFLRKPEWLLMGPTREREWSSCFQILEEKADICSGAFSPKGRHLALVESSSNQVRIYDVVTGECLNVLNGSDDARYIIGSVAFSPSGQYVASISGNGYICVWDATTGVCLKRFHHSFNGTFQSNWFPDELFLVAFPDDENVLSIDLYGRIRTWHIKTGDCKNIAKTGGDRKFGSLSRNGRRAAWISKDGRRIEVVDIVAGQYHETPWHKDITALRGNLYHDRACVTLSPNGELVAVATVCDEHQTVVGGNACHFQVWNVATSEHIGTLHRSRSERMIRMSLSPDHRYLAVISLSRIMEWEIATSQQVSFTTDFGKDLKTTIFLEFSPDSKLLVSAGEDSEPVYVWDMVTTRLRHQPSKDFYAGIAPLTLSPNGMLLAILDHNDDFQIWDTINNKNLLTITRENYWVNNDWAKDKWARAHTTFSPDNRHVTCAWSAAEGDSTIEFFDTVTSRRRWRTSTVECQKLPLSHSTIQLFDASTGTHLSTFQIAADDGKPKASSLRSIDKRAGVSMAFPGLELDFDPSPFEIELQILDEAWGSCAYSIILPNHHVIAWQAVPLFNHNCTFSPDGKYIAYCDPMERVIIEDAATRVLIRRLVGFGYDVLRSGDIRWGLTGLLTDRGIYGTQALLNDSRVSIEYGYDDIPAGTISGTGISENRDWILKNGECYLWIPLEHRQFLNYRQCCPNTGTTIAFGDNFDQIYCFRFTPADSE